MYEYKCRYTDFFNNEREETFRFNLTESEVLNKELTTQGGLQNLLERMTQKQDIPSLATFFREFLEISYGEISPDGRNFDKSPEIWKHFESSNAYNKLYMDLLSDDDFALDFIAGVIPSAPSAKEAPNNQNLIAIEQAKARAEARLAERTQ
jgi:hypothetical protein